MKLVTSPPRHRRSQELHYMAHHRNTKILASNSNRGNRTTPQLNSNNSTYNIYLLLLELYHICSKCHPSNPKILSLVFCKNGLLLVSYTCFRLYVYEYDSYGNNFLSFIYIHLTKKLQKKKNIFNILGTKDLYMFFSLLLLVKQNTKHLLIILSKKKNTTLKFMNNYNTTQRYKAFVPCPINSSFFFFLSFSDL